MEIRFKPYTEVSHLTRHQHRQWNISKLLLSPLLLRRCCCCYCYCFVGKLSITTLVFPMASVVSFEMRAKNIVLLLALLFLSVTSFPCCCCCCWWWWCGPFCYLLLYKLLQWSLFPCKDTNMTYLPERSKPAVVKAVTLYILKTKKCWTFFFTFYVTYASYLTLALFLETMFWVFIRKRKIWLFRKTYSYRWRESPPYFTRFS